MIALQSKIDAIKRDRTITKDEKESRIAAMRGDMDKAKAVEAKHKDEVSKLISDAEAYLKEHFVKDYYLAVKESCAQEKILVQEKYNKKKMCIRDRYQIFLTQNSLLWFLLTSRGGNYLRNLL